MNWLESLLWDSSSVAHIVCLYAFVISVGVLLGKIKIFGVSLGVTFVLFAGILMGHFGFTGETHILHFIREFGLILFVFCIGLQVGPSFFSSFKKGGMRLNMLAVGIVLLNIAVALSIYFIDGGIDLPMIVGILYGAVTNTPGLGAEIASTHFQGEFSGKKTLENGEVVLGVVKNGKVEKPDYQVDGISGGTITSVGVDAMLKACLSSYKNFLTNNNEEE